MTHPKSTITLNPSAAKLCRCTPLTPSSRLRFQFPHGHYSFIVGPPPPSPCRTSFNSPRTPLKLISFSQAPESATDEPNNKNDWKSKAKRSPQLKRWSMARSLRSSRTRNTTTLPQRDETLNPSSSTNGNGRESEDDNWDSDWESSASAGKAIYMVSDGTGWTAEHSVNAALGQFEHCLADRACAVNTHLFSGIDDVDQLMEIIRQAAEEQALVLYTLADGGMAEAAKKGCDMWGVPATDILGPTTEAIAAHLGVAPLGLGRGSPTRVSPPLSKHYFKRIEAVEFTIKHDDGALPQNLHEADLVLVGVSRTSKTPLSTYLAQKGYKVSNVPLVLGVDPPKQLFEVDADKVFALVISPAILQSIRAARAHALGFSFNSDSNYSEMDHIRQELDYANKIFAQNRRWPVIEVTGKAIEETAAVVLRIYHERKQKYEYTLPRISKRY